MITQPVRRALLAVDVERSGDPRRDSRAWVEFRQALFAAVAAAFAEGGIDLGQCQTQDNGDGLTVSIPDTVPRERLVHPLLVTLARKLRDHNLRASQSTQLRVRVALHDGDVPVDDQGQPTGPQLVHLARLLDCPALREALAMAPATATVAAILSDRFHGAVVLHGYAGIDAEVFRPVEVRHKETTAQGWITVPGHAEQAAPRRNRGLVIALSAVLVAVVIAAGVIWLIRGNRSDDSGALPSTSDSRVAPGDCVDQYFEQEPRIPYPVIYDLPQDVPAKRLIAGTFQHPSGGVLRRDRTAVGATRFYYDETGTGFAVLDVVDASCHPVPAATRKVAADAYVVSFQLDGENQELDFTVTFTTLDVTFRGA